MTTGAVQAPPVTPQLKLAPAQTLQCHSLTPDPRFCPWISWPSYQWTEEQNLLLDTGIQADIAPTFCCVWPILFLIGTSSNVITSRKLAESFLEEEFTFLVICMTFTTVQKHLGCRHVGCSRQSAGRFAVMWSPWHELQTLDLCPACGRLGLPAASVLPACGGADNSHLSSA